MSAGISAAALEIIKKMQQGELLEKAALFQYIKLFGSRKHQKRNGCEGETTAHKASHIYFSHG